ncbi:hypothetical protein E2562_020833 [Oryza meyeriana var. granulata]|uniref:Uncharacterized protein n=1 Tax=Oryza meyeriana var. granulata TaxID=110450 RepID=A0A6G1CG88_9ORYZ|nr:hypothetical protein E2562_020833 [Oryza meyeriana var. granulata]
MLRTSCPAAAILAPLLIQPGEPRAPGRGRTVCAHPPGGLACQRVRDRAARTDSPAAWARRSLPITRMRHATLVSAIDRSVPPRPARSTQRNRRGMRCEPALATGGDDGSNNAIHPAASRP